MSDLTRRFAPLAFELRDDSSSSAVLEGYAATFSQPYDMGLFTETVLPGAFQRSLASDPDVRFLVDHEGTPLARTKSGTLALSEDSTGLHVRADLDMANPHAVGIVSAVRRGDLDAMSFAFRVSKNGDEWNDDYTQRSLKAVSINDGDVSVVTHPANPTTSIAARSRDLSAAAEVVDAVTRELRAGRDVNPASLALLKRAVVLLGVTDLDELPVDEERTEPTGRPTSNARRLLALL